VAYESWLTEEGLPKVQGRDVSTMFTESFFARSQPVFAELDDWNTWGAVQAPPEIPKPLSTTSASQPQSSSQAGWFTNLLIGLLLGVALYVLFTYREKIFSALKGLAGNKSGEEASNG
jgi:hypothetical protein